MKWFNNALKTYNDLKRETKFHYPWHFYIMMLIFIIYLFIELFKGTCNRLYTIYYVIWEKSVYPKSLEPQYTSTWVRVSISGSSAQHPKEGIDGCGRGVRTSIGTLASTKAHPPHAMEKRTARSVTTDRTIFSDNISLSVILMLSKRLAVINWISLDFYLNEDILINDKV